MSNVGSGSSPTPRAPSGRTYWVRSNLGPSVGGEKPPPSRDPTGKRFVEPYRLTDQQRAALIAHLEEQDIGDSESRSLFAAAMEYDLAGCRDLIEPAPERAAPRSVSLESDETLARLATLAQSLAEQLCDLDEVAERRLCLGLEESDRFKRSYGAEYLKTLRAELERVTQAADTLTPSPPTAAPEADLPDNARQFIRRAGDTFRDCFEQQPTAEQDAPFVLAVQGIATTTGIRVPTDPGSLAQVLAQTR